MGTVLEICVDSIASARAAAEGGADRLELCSALALGGLSPDTALLRRVKSACALPVRCLMRPRMGDFCYSDEEIALLTDQIEALRAAGADGFVLGALTPEGTLDVPNIRRLLRACGGVPVTLHRCIDVSRDLCEAYRTATEWGFDTVLTSGGAASCQNGAEEIRKLLALRDEMHGPEVLIGAGVNANVMAALREKLPAARAFHMSGKTEIESKMAFRRAGVPIGLPGLDEWHILQTDPAAVRAAKQVLQ